MVKVPPYSHTDYASARTSVSRGWKWVAALSFFLLAGIVFHSWHQVLAKGASPEKTIEGTVRDDKGIVSGAVVRIQATAHSAVTNAEGEFELGVPEPFQVPVKLTAWARGYYISGPVEASPGDKGVTISLHRHSQWDNREYKWLPSLQSAGSGENQGCAECHFRGEEASGPLLPVDEWLNDAHSQSAVNPIFLTMHSGKDMSGRQSPGTR